ncbi:MAG: hypothetical protein QOE55_8334 [Acidobacteriaceae bacterium]|jgi:hypothetical protein|nr:hypothetical protein [Acidobacteriaceae bacterium]
MKNSPCQFVAVLATIQLSERSSAFRLVVNISKAMDGFVDAPEFGDSLSELCWAVINPKGSHDRRRLHHTQLQRSGQPQDVVPVLPNEIRVDAMPATLYRILAPCFLIAGSLRGCEVSSTPKACGNVAQLVAEE